MGGLARWKRPSSRDRLWLLKQQPLRGKEAFQVNHSTRSKRIRQRPKTNQIRRHQNQPLLWPERVGPPRYLVWVTCAMAGGSCWTDKPATEHQNRRFWPLWRPPASPWLRQSAWLCGAPAGSTARGKKPKEGAGGNRGAGSPSFHPQILRKSLILRRYLRIPNSKSAVLKARPAMQRR